MARPRLLVASLLVLALGLRVAWVVHTDPLALTSDPSIYDRYAREIANGSYPTRSELGVGPTADKPPLYPSVLGGLYALPTSGELGARFAEAVFGALTVGLIGLLGWRIWGKRVGLLSLALAAIFPPLIVTGTSLITEAIFVPLALGAVVAALRARRLAGGYRYLILAGVLGGLTALTRTNGPLLVILIAILVWVGPARLTLRSIERPAIVLLAALLTIAPWTIRNAIVMHSFVPITTAAGETLAGTYNATSNRRGGYWLAPYEVPELASYYSPRRFTEVELDRKLRGTAWRYIRDHPGYVLEVGAKNTLRMAGLSGDSRKIVDLDQPPFPLGLGYGSFYVLALLAAAGLRTRAVRRAPWAFWAIPVAFAASAIFIEGWIRFRSPVDPFLIFLAALAIDRLPIRQRPT